MWSTARSPRLTADTVQISCFRPIGDGSEHETCRHGQAWHLGELVGQQAIRQYVHRVLRRVSAPWGYSRRPKSPGSRINAYPRLSLTAVALRVSLLGDSGGTAPDSHRTSFTAVVTGTQSHRRNSGQRGVGPALWAARRKSEVRAAQRGQRAWAHFGHTRPRPGQAAPAEAELPWLTQQTPAT